MGDRLTNTYLVAHNIISSLGFTTRANMDAIQAYTSGIKPIEEGLVSDIPILAGLINADELRWQVKQCQLETYSKLEQIVILSVKDALAQIDINPSDSSCGLILSTTKGNIDLLANNTSTKNENTLLSHTASAVADYFGMGDRVSTISNACISGVSAIIAAQRWIQAHKYKHVIVVGADILSHFVTSGFLSFRSVSENICRPYDASRDGLSLGEACGTIILSSTAKANAVVLRSGAISNDANHISGPSRTGDGLVHAMQGAMQQANISPDDIHFVNLHGTATIYNDEMEAKAMHLAKLQYVPANSLKPYFGHTLGASGVIETIACIHQLQNKQVFGTLGYKQCGVSQEIEVDSMHRNISHADTCVKTASGFGGCNAAIVLSLLPNTVSETRNIEIAEVRKCTIEDSTIRVNESIVFSSISKYFPTFIREAYKQRGESYQKFYKMDDMCKLGYIAAAHLLHGLTFAPCQMGIILANSSSSLDTDSRYQELIDVDGDKVASPAIFVYTLPNIVAGEICIKHKIQGENTFFVEENYDSEKMKEYAQLTMQASGLRYCIYGWCEYYKNEYKAEFILLERNDMEQLIEKLKGELIEELNLEEMTPADIDTDAPLFGEGLGLDSIDALEIILILERNYGVKVKKPSDGNAKAIFRSVRTLAEFITANRK